MRSSHSCTRSALGWMPGRNSRAPGTGIPGVIALGTRRGSFGKDFPAGEAVEVSDLHPDHQAKLVANGMFKTSCKPAEPEIPPAPAVG